jgi:drug/metabolite transporter (DMT)-like permease
MTRRATPVLVALVAAALFGSAAPASKLLLAELPPFQHHPAVSTFSKGVVAGSANLAIGVALTPLTAPAWQIGAALTVGAFAYGASIALYIRAAQDLGAVRAQALFASAPFVGAAISCALLGEALDPRTLVAAALLAGSAWLLFGDMHAHRHQHLPIEHVHSHRHDDDHHDHLHADLAPAAQHSHSHRHAAIAHTHPHWPDLHHRHQH